MSHKEKRKHSLAWVIMEMSVIPILLLGIVLSLYSQNSVREGMVFETKMELSGIAHNIISSYNMLDGGDFSYQEGKVMKGERDFTSDYRLLDDMKNDTGADVSVCMGGERVLTTLVDGDGNRMVGSQEPPEIQEYVLEMGEDYFSESIEVGNTTFFGYYVPLTNLDGQVVGLVFAGKSAESVSLSMDFMVQGNLIICIFIVLLAGFICHLMSNRIVNTITYIKIFLGRLAKGKFDHKMPEAVMKRNDELGEMGHYAVAVSDSLEDMVTKDPLTKLLNRRACMTRIQDLWERGNLCIVMGDIDFFKKVNDSYGHDKGDEVLVHVATILKEEVGEDGFVARWGGEEFLIILTGNANRAYEIFEEATRKIKEKMFDTGFEDGSQFKITMTVGIVSQDPEEDFEANVKRADDLLYYGKEHGRNQIVMEKRGGVQAD